MVYKIDKIYKDIVGNLCGRVAISEENTVHIKVFKAELKRSTQIINDDTINKWMGVLRELGYIKPLDINTVELCISIDQPYIFRSNQKK